VKLCKCGRLDVSRRQAEQEAVRGEPLEQPFDARKHPVALGVGDGRAEVLEPRRHQQRHLRRLGFAPEAALERTPPDNRIRLPDFGEQFHVGVDGVQIAEGPTPRLAAGTAASTSVPSTSNRIACGRSIVVS